MKIETWPLERIRPYGRNARKIPQSAVDKVAASLQEFGWRQPIVVEPNGNIVVGHVRRQAALKLGWTEAPVHIAADLSPAQLKAYRLMDNRSHDEATWDETLLGPELLEIRELGGDFDLGLTGFDLPEIEDFLARTSADSGATDDDAAPALPTNPVARTGDVWLMPASTRDRAPHRLLCGDSTAAADVERLMAGRKASMVFTDPPYGVNFGEANHNPRAKRWAKIENDDKTGDVLNEFQRKCFANIVQFSGTATPCYIWSATMGAGYETLKALVDAGIHVQSQVLWVKNCLVLGQADYQWKHEPCWYGWTPGKNHYWEGGRAQTTVWEISKDANASYQHPAQKPTALAELAIQNSCPAGAIVLDIFGGSGSTMVACEKTGRVCHSMELDRGYVDVAVIRWQEFTRREATLDGDGRTFAQVRADRLAPAPPASEHPEDDQSAAEAERIAELGV